MAVTISLEKLLEGGAHFGHQMRRWNPKMADFMHESKDGVFVFDLIKTKSCIEEALEVLKKAAQAQKTILFLGTKKQIKEKVREVAKEVGEPFITERWLGGTFTNFNQIKRSKDKLPELRKQRETARAEGFTKKEILLLDREIEKLEKTFGGISDLNVLPDILIIIDTHKERSAVIEANRVGIPILGIVDSNANPEDIAWPIPMNDDATSALEYVLDLIKEAILEGKKKHGKK